MLIGYKPGETMEEILYRYQLLKDAGCKPFPMVYDNLDPKLKKFQRWVIRRYDDIVPWETFSTVSYRPHQGPQPLPLWTEDTGEKANTIIEGEEIG